MGKLRDPEREAFQPFGDVVGRGLALQRGVHRQHHFVHPALLHACQQLADGEVFGPHAVERREPAAQHMILAGEEPGAVERPEIGDFFHHADGFRIAPGIGADTAGIRRVDIAANRAFDQRLAHRRQRIEQLHQRRLAPLHQPQHRAPRRAGAKAGKPRQSAHQRLDLLRCHRAADRGRSAPEKGPNRSYAHRLHGNPGFCRADAARAGGCRT